MLSGNYLVTGAAGLMGSTALLRLSNIQGVNVRAVYHEKIPTIKAENISFIKADLRDKKNCNDVVRDIDYVFMFASILSTASMLAKNPVSHITDTLILNVRMLEAAYFAGVKKIIWLSSSTGYPDGECVLNEDDMFRGDPPDIYFSVGWMTRYIETLCRFYATKIKNPMQVIILRPTTIFGEYETYNLDRCHMLPALVRKVVERNNPIEVWGTGDNLRDLIHSDDIFETCLQLMKNKSLFNIFNIGYGKQYSVNELLYLIIELDSYENAKIIYNNSKPNAINKREINFNKIKKELHYQPKVKIEEGIKRLIIRCRELIEKGKLDD